MAAAAACALLDEISHRCDDRASGVGASPSHDEHKTATESSTGKLTQVTFWSNERKRRAGGRTDGQMRGPKLRDSSSNQRKQDYMPTTRQGTLKKREFFQVRVIAYYPYYALFLPFQLGFHKYLQMCGKIRGLGCVTRALAHARFTQPRPHIFLHFCMT